MICLCFANSQSRSRRRKSTDLSRTRAISICAYGRSRHSSFFPLRNLEAQEHSCHFGDRDSETSQTLLPNDFRSPIGSAFIPLFTASILLYTLPTSQNHRPLRLWISYGSRATPLPPPRNLEAQLYGPGRCTDPILSCLLEPSTEGDNAPSPFVRRFGLALGFLLAAFTSLVVDLQSCSLIASCIVDSLMCAVDSLMPLDSFLHLSLIWSLLFVLVLVRFSAFGALSGVLC